MRKKSKEGESGRKSLGLQGSSKKGSDRFRGSSRQSYPLEKSQRVQDGSTLISTVPVTGWEEPVGSLAGGDPEGQDLAGDGGGGGASVSYASAAGDLSSVSMAAIPVY